MAIPRELESIAEESPFWHGMSQVEKELFAEEMCSMYGSEYHDAIYGREGELFGMHVERQGTDRWIW